MKQILKEAVHHFFADEGEYKPAGIPSTGYFILMTLTIFLIYEGLMYTEHWSYDRLRLLIRSIITVLWILEIIKIGYRWHYGYKKQLNTWVPLYFCSITLFAGILSSCTTGILQHIGDVFMASGGLIGGICFLLYPSTSLLTFPAYHFLSIHSFLYHGCMTYIGLLLNRSGLVNLTWNDMICYSLYVLFFCTLALILNKKTDSNLMFISRSFPGSLYKLVRFIFRRFYTPFMIIVQMVPPYQFVMLMKYYTPLFIMH